MPLQTLGDAIDERMHERGDSPESAAESLGVTVEELGAWLDDRQLPHHRDSDAVLRYLEVDEVHFRGLCLRSQMRHVQDVIRSGDHTAQAG